MIFSHHFPRFLVRVISGSRLHFYLQLPLIVSAFCTLPTQAALPDYAALLVAGSAATAALLYQPSGVGQERKSGALWRLVLGRSKDLNHSVRLYYAKKYSYKNSGELHMVDQELLILPGRERHYISMQVRKPPTHLTLSGVCACAVSDG